MADAKEGCTPGGGIGVPLVGQSVRSSNAMEAQGRTDSPVALDANSAPPAPTRALHAPPPARTMSFGNSLRRTVSAFAKSAFQTPLNSTESMYARQASLENRSANSMHAAARRGRRQRTPHHGATALNPPIESNASTPSAHHSDGHPHVGDGAFVVDSSGSESEYNVYGNNDHNGSVDTSDEDNELEVMLFGKKAVEREEFQDPTAITANYMIHPNSPFRRFWNLATVRRGSADAPGICRHVTLLVFLLDSACGCAAVLDPLRPWFQFPARHRREPCSASMVHHRLGHGKWMWED